MSLECTGDHSFFENNVLGKEPKSAVCSGSWFLVPGSVICIIWGIAFGYCSCDKIQSYPAQPQIGYESYRLVDTFDKLQNPVKKLAVSFSFMDGDGDLFKPLTDTARNDSLNSKLFFSLYQRVNGKYEKVPDSWFKVKPQYSFGWDDLMSRGGQNKTQKGSMEFYYLFYCPLPFDTIAVSFYIVDMAYHKSNVDSVPAPIVLKP